MVFDLEDEHYPAPRRDRRTISCCARLYVDLGWRLGAGRHSRSYGARWSAFSPDVVRTRHAGLFCPELEACGSAVGPARSISGPNAPEFLWVPKPLFDEIGEPGDDLRLSRGCLRGRCWTRTVRAGSGWLELGRASRLVDGWTSAPSTTAATMSRRRYTPLNQGVARPATRPDRAGWRHFSKDLGSFVLKGEAVHTHGRSLNTFSSGPGLHRAFADRHGRLCSVDVPGATGASTCSTTGAGWRSMFRHDGRSARTGRHPAGRSAAGTNLEAEVLALSSINRSDHLIRPKLIGNSPRHGGLVGGVDVFGGMEGVFQPLRSERSGLSRTAPHVLECPLAGSGRLTGHRPGTNGGLGDPAAGDEPDRRSCIRRSWRATLLELGQGRWRSTAGC